MPLNPGQAAAVDACMGAFLGNGEHGRNLIGEGGTGKTYTAIKVSLTAPTNKAVKQLQKAAKDYDFPPDMVCFMTIHSALGLSMMPSEENKYVTQVRDSILHLFDVVGIDEGSMLSWRILENYLMAEQQHHQFKFKYLMIGDDMQLPPVKEKESTAFNYFESNELTQPERQRTNPDGTPNGILELTAPLRTAIKENKAYSLKKLPDHNVTLVKDADFLKMIAENFDADTDLDTIRVLAWRNDRVDEINRLIRRKLYGKDADPFVVGDERRQRGDPRCRRGVHRRSCPRQLGNGRGDGSRLQDVDAHATAAPR